MRSLKRKVADAVGSMIGAHIVPSQGISGLYEQDRIRQIMQAFDVDCVFDIGANSGQYATMLRDRIPYKGPIISFEPVPHLCDELTLQAASDPDWHIRSVALDRETRDAIFRITTDTQFSSLRRPSRLGQALFGGQVRVTNELSLTTSTLAAEHASWKKKLGFTRPYLKMDTQGNDIAVAEGAGVALSSFVAIQTETAISKLYDGIPDLAETLAFFNARGFELSAIVPNNDGLFPRLLETDCIFVNKALIEDSQRDMTEAKVH
ncbi:MAG: FkbM family methyltransferase [Beijerinckiaceae bacterium]